MTAAPTILHETTNLAAAYRFAARCKANGHSVVIFHGDCPHFWVVDSADAARLEKIGYEPVPDLD